MGLVQNYAGLLTARIFLGITEAGLFPVSTIAPCVEGTILHTLCFAL
jgi:hypothetical protein